MVDFKIESQDSESFSELVREELGGQVPEKFNYRGGKSTPLWTDGEDVDIVSSIEFFAKEIRDGL